MNASLSISPRAAFPLSAAEVCSPPTVVRPALDAISATRHGLSVPCVSPPRMSCANLRNDTRELMPLRTRELGLCPTRLHRGGSSSLAVTTDAAPEGGIDHSAAGWHSSRAAASSRSRRTRVGSSGAYSPAAMSIIAAVSVLAHPSSV